MFIDNNQVFLTNEERAAYLNSMLELNECLTELQIQVIYV